MTKGLEAITSPISSELRNGKQYYTYTKEDVETIEKELKRLEELEEEKQSFDRQLEKKLKALEIIKRFSCYDIEFLDYLLVNEGKISQKECDLLKEVLL